MERGRKIKLAYVSGPYRSSDGICGIWQNIQNAWQIALQLWDIDGLAVVTPHLNTMLMDSNRPDDWQKWIRGDLAILERCDLIVMLPGWQTSSGAKAELDHALSRGLPAYFWPMDEQKLREGA